MFVFVCNPFFCPFMIYMNFLYGNQEVNGEIHQPKGANDGGNLRIPAIEEGLK